MGSRQILTELDSVARILSRQIPTFIMEGGNEPQRDVVLYFDAQKRPLDTFAHVELIEDNPCASMTCVTITDLSPETLVLKPDNFSIRYYKHQTLNKACDYLLLTNYGNDKYAIFIDLKTTIHEQPDNNRVFQHRDSEDAEIVWQMAGADAMFDSVIDVVSKRNSLRHQAVAAQKKNSARSELAKYQRRYLILYKNVIPTVPPSTTGIVSTTTTPPVPNPYVLEQDIRAVSLNNRSRVSIGDVISWCA